MHTKGSTSTSHSLNVSPSTVHQDISGHIQSSASPIGNTLSSSIDTPSLLHVLDFAQLQVILPISPPHFHTTTPNIHNGIQTRLKTEAITR